MMSLKRNAGGAGRSHFGSGSDPGTKIDRQSLYDELKRLSEANQTFAPTDIALTIGAGEPAVSKALLGLAAEGYLEKVEAGKYRANNFVEVPQAEFVKALSRASKTDSTRQKDLTEIQRLKQNNDIMRGRLLQVVAERDHYLALLKKNSIDPGQVPVVTANSAGPPPSGDVTLPGTSESSVLPSGPGAAPVTAPDPDNGAS
jgi:hypothetical protein